MHSKEEVAQKRKPGRPSKAPNGKPRITTAMRLREEIRDRLVDAAESSNRSLAEEVEYRLERSFVRDALSKHIDQMLDDSLIRGEEVDRFQAKVEKLETEVAELKTRLQEAMKQQRAAA